MAPLDLAGMQPRAGVGRARLRRLIGPTIAALIGVAILVSLGNWQLRRLAWKEGLLAQIAARAHAPPQPLPPEASWGNLSPEDYEYRHVRLRGVFENDKETLVFDPGDDSRPGDDGPGYLVLTPLRLADGSHVIVDRGFVPVELKDPKTRAAGQITGETEVTGLMRSPEPRDLFTPADDPAKGTWFTRDPAEISAYWSLAHAAPFSVDADPIKTAPGLPAGGATAINLPNNHFSYAITWFGLAGALVGVYASFARKRLREP